MSTAKNAYGSRIPQVQPHIEVQVQSYNLDFANHDGGNSGGAHHQMISTFQKPAQAQYPIEY